LDHRGVIVNPQSVLLQSALRADDETKDQILRSACFWWRCRDLNPGLCGYEPHALPTELHRRQESETYINRRPFVNEKKRSRDLAVKAQASPQARPGQVRAGP
jgi:hypothetical protein